ncbi:MAG: response regulator [Alphaproteobacteria bacterium]|nr:response regulator [Alphaproteobacteria bacterium]
MANILIAEDDTSMLGFLKLALEKAGHTVTDKTNGVDALETLKNENAVFDLLLTDIVMPGMDGIELSQQATKFQPELKVMFITGFSAVAVGREDIKEDKAKVLSKPFHLNDLVEQVETLLAA